MMTNEDGKLINAEGSARTKKVHRWNLRDRKTMQLSKAKQQLALTESSGKRKESRDEDFPNLPSFVLELKAVEIAEDLLAVTGKLPSRRPKKRDNKVQKQLDRIFPGGYLDSITVDRYKVPKNSRKAN